MGRRALLMVDVQNDFTEGGALGVAGGAAVAAGVAELLAGDHGCDLVIASRDWHAPSGDNGGHFSAEPDYLDTWPVHCVAETDGAAYRSELPTELIDVHIHKGYGEPAYSAFEGSVARLRAQGPAAEAIEAGGGAAALLGIPAPEALRRLEVEALEVVGIATDHCVLASARDALAAGIAVTLRTDLVAGVDPEASERALRRLVEDGAELR